MLSSVFSFNTIRASAKRIKQGEYAKTRKDVLSLLIFSQHLWLSTSYLFVTILNNISIREFLLRISLVQRL